MQCVEAMRNVFGLLQVVMIHWNKHKSKYLYKCQKWQNLYFVIWTVIGEKNMETNRSLSVFCILYILLIKLYVQRCMIFRGSKYLHLQCVDSIKFLFLHFHQFDLSICFPHAVTFLCDDDKMLLPQHSRKLFCLAWIQVLTPYALLRYPALPRWHLQSCDLLLWSQCLHLLLLLSHSLLCRSCCWQDQRP